MCRFFLLIFCVTRTAAELSFEASEATVTASYKQRLNSDLTVLPLNAPEGLNRNLFPNNSLLQNLAFALVALAVGFAVLQCYALLRASKPSSGDSIISRSLSDSDEPSCSVCRSAWKNKADLQRGKGRIQALVASFMRSQHQSTASVQLSLPDFMVKVYPPLRLNNFT